MYGVGVGTGITGGSFLAVGMVSGWYILAIIAAICLLAGGGILVYNATHRQAHQRP